jgi:hypothetical protein
MESFHSLTRILANKWRKVARTPVFVSQRIPVISFRPAKSIFHGEVARCSYLMQNLAEGFGQFRPGPSLEELNHMLNPPQ